MVFRYVKDIGTRDMIKLGSGLSDIFAHQIFMFLTKYSGCATNNRTVLVTGHNLFDKYLLGFDSIFFLSLYQKMPSK